MASPLLDTVVALRRDPTRVVVLYAQLYASRFFVQVQAGSEADIRSALFLTYDTRDNIKELPIYTSLEAVLPGVPSDAVTISVDGPTLWPRLLNVIQTGQCEAAVDPGAPHAIRVTREMILGMVRQYAT